MPNFVVYDTGGNILRAGSCSNEAIVEFQAVDPGESVITFVGDIEIEADPKTKKVVDGEIVEKTP